MFTKYKLVIVFIGLVLLGACGSGGGGGGDSSSTSTPAPTPTDTNLAFQLFPAGFFSSGYTETYQLSGSDTNGGAYTATLSATTQAQTTFNGQPAIPVQSVVKITNTQTGAFVTGTSTGYHSTDSGSRMYLGFTDNTTSTTYTAVSLNIIPQSAKIGDIGVVGTYSGGGETDQISWQLTNANNGLANLVTNNTTTISGNLQWSEEHIFVIDQQGNRKSLTIKIYYASNGVTITLSGNKQ